MTDTPLFLCPVDFSEPSRTALRYAGAAADHFGARMLVMSVDDPLLATVAATRGELAGATARELREFVDATLPIGSGPAKSLDVRVAVGKPAAEILRVARESNADLIVMSSQGRSGAAKRFFGSTTEGVLRSTTTPVLVTPKENARVGSLPDIARSIGCILAPVDLSPASQRQVAVAAQIATSLSAPVVVPYVIEPVFVPPSVLWAVSGLESDRRAEAEASLRDLVRAAASERSVETLVLTGDASEEIAKLAAARNAGLIVMGLHSSALLGPRMGSVTYRVLSMVEALVLAIPPASGSSSNAAR
jgi:nucleotide-binding universal stress UspA family protein